MATLMHPQKNMYVFYDSVHANSFVFPFLARCLLMAGTPIHVPGAGSANLLLRHWTQKTDHARLHPRKHIRNLFIFSINTFYVTLKIIQDKF